MEVVREQGTEIGVASACRALDVPRASFYRALSPGKAGVPTTQRPVSPRALAPEERREVLGMLNSERFVDDPPHEVYATLLDEGKYLCSVRTMYRILESEGESRERRNQARHPVYVKPELSATQPNELWSWDITKLLGPAKWTYFYLYVILDVFSRYVVGWMAAYRETAALASRLIEETCLKQGIQKGRLTVHADRGTSMKSKCVAMLLSDLGVTKTHSRPHVSNDNPFSESQFRTLKYRPEFPKRFGCIQDARAFSGIFSIGTTTNIITPGSGSLHRQRSISAWRPKLSRLGNRYLTKRTCSILNASFASRPRPRCCRMPSGSTPRKTVNH